MAPPRRFVLADANVRQRCADFVLKQAQEGYEVIVRERKRTGGQSARFHAMCGDIERSGLLWFGKRRTRDEWKTLLVSGFSIVHKEGSEVVPGIEHEVVSLRESTTGMPRSRMAALIEYASAFCAEHGVRLTAPDRDE